MFAWCTYCINERICLKVLEFLVYLWIFSGICVVVYFWKWNRITRQAGEMRGWIDIKKMPFGKDILKGAWDIIMWIVIHGRVNQETHWERLKFSKTLAWCELWCITCSHFIFLSCLQLVVIEPLFLCICICYRLTILLFS
jgi:hypothetical protein